MLLFHSQSKPSYNDFFLWNNYQSKKVIYVLIFFSFQTASTLNEKKNEKKTNDKQQQQQQQQQQNKQTSNQTKQNQSKAFTFPNNHVLASN